MDNKFPHHTTRHDVLFQGRPVWYAMVVSSEFQYVVLRRMLEGVVPVVLRPRDATEALTQGTTSTRPPVSGGLTRKSRPNSAQIPMHQTVATSPHTEIDVGITDPHLELSKRYERWATEAESHRSPFRVMGIWNAVAQEQRSIDPGTLSSWVNSCASEKASLSPQVAATDLLRGMQEVITYPMKREASQQGPSTATGGAGPWTTNELVVLELILFGYLAPKSTGQHKQFCLGTKDVSLDKLAAHLSESNVDLVRSRDAHKLERPLAVPLVDTLFRNGQVRTALSRWWLSMPKIGRAGSSGAATPEPAAITKLSYLTMTFHIHMALFGSIANYSAETLKCAKDLCWSDWKFLLGVSEKKHGGDDGLPGGAKHATTTTSALLQSLKYHVQREPTSTLGEVLFGVGLLTLIEPWMESTLAEERELFLATLYPRVFELRQGKPSLKQLPELPVPRRSPRREQAEILHDLALRLKGATQTNFRAVQKLAQQHQEREARLLEKALRRRSTPSATAAVVRHVSDSFGLERVFFERFTKQLMGQGGNKECPESATTLLQVAEHMAPKLTRFATLHAPTVSALCNSIDVIRGDDAPSTNSAVQAMAMSLVAPPVPRYAKPIHARPPLRAASASRQRFAGMFALHGREQVIPIDGSPNTKPDFVSPYEEVGRFPPRRPLTAGTRRPQPLADPIADPVA